MKTVIKTAAAKAFQRNSRWMEKPPHAPIPVCSCGNKYIKSRVGQVHCLRCIHDPSVAATL